MSWIEWIELYGPNNEPVFMRVKDTTAIAAMKEAHPELTDEEALEEFTVVNWATKYDITVTYRRDNDRKAHK